MECHVRTNIDINEDLLEATMKLSGKRTKKAAIEEAMREYTRTQRLRAAIERMRGVGWEGDLDAMREGWYRLDEL